jgi:hypothetical protein
MLQLIGGTVMPRRRLDPLLTTARLLLTLGMGLSALTSISCVIAAPSTVLLAAQIAPDFIRHGLNPNLWWLAGLLVQIALGAVLSFFFFRHLYRIVGTVAEGDPFVPANAARLRGMGWIALATQVLLVGLALTAFAVAGTTAREPPDLGLSGTLGILLLALVLFVLARVFREGARLRDELEGTV